MNSDYMNKIQRSVIGTPFSNLNTQNKRPYAQPPTKAMVLSQADILMRLVQGQEGRAWAMGKKGWDVTGGSDSSTASVCDWSYIECDSYGTTVVGISMPEADFAGTLPSDLGMLVTLEKISMRRNLVVGKIPQEVANLPHLKTFVLAENRLTGTIPTFLSFNLHTVDLSYNLLEGRLGSDFADSVRRLENLDIAGNRISGTIPESFINSEKLYTLSLSENSFHGTIPTFFGDKMPSLTYLYLDGNHLMGTIPPQLSGQDSVSLFQELWLQNNLLTGTVPPSIGEMPDLFNFYIDGNKLTGTIPKNLCREEMNADFFQDVTDDTKNRNYCDSVACPAGKVSFEGVYPCEKCEDSFFNPYLGRVDQCVDLNERDILDALYEATSGDDWSSGLRWEIDGMYCDKLKDKGVTCDSNENIIAIDLKGQGLRGTIPEEIGFLRFLERLDLSDNYLTGFLPSDLRWAPLERLDVSGNRIEGIVPWVLCTKEGINGNGREGDSGCDFIQCSPGHYSKFGYATEKYPCRPCRFGEDTPYIGSKQCSSVFVSKENQPKQNWGITIQAGLAFFMLLGAIIAGYILIVLKLNKMGGGESKRLPTEDNDFEDDGGRPVVDHQRLSETVVLS